MMNLSRILAFVCTLLVPILLSGQTAWTLEECLQHANENSIQLKQEELKVAAQSHSLLASKMNLLPTLNLRGSNTNRFGRSVDPLTYEFTTDDTRGASFSAYSGIDLFRGFQNVNTVRKSKIDLQKTLSEFDQAKKDLELNITRDFLQILFYLELQKVAEDEAEITRLQVMQTKNFVEAGSLTQGDLQEILALQALEELNIVNAQNDYNLSLLNLALLLQLDDPESFKISQPEANSMPEIFVQPQVESIISEAENNRPSIFGAELGIQSSQKSLLIAKGSLLPSISLTSGWGTGYSDQIFDISEGNIMPFMNQLDFASTTYLGLSLNIPLFNGLSGITKVKNAKLDVINNQLILDQAKNQLRKEIYLAYADANASFTKFQATTKSLSSLQLAFENIERKYNLGMLTALDYNTAKNNVVRAQSELLQAKYNYLFNIKILNFYRGLQQ